MWLQASTRGRKSFGGLDSQWTTSKCPFEGFSHRLIEVGDEVQNPLPQVCN